jgi:hypothetical protein
MFNLEELTNSNGKKIYLVMLALLAIGMGCLFGLTDNISKDKDAKKHNPTAICASLFVSLFVAYALLKDSKLVPMLNE